MIDTEGLLREISPGDPCGDDLEYDPAYGALERAALGKAEQQIGDTIVPAEAPEWADVRARSLALFDRTKDLRVALHLTRALVKTEGWTGFRDGLAVVKGLLERHWDTLHPRLDPDDDNDPTLRVNIIAALCDPDAMLDGLRSAPLVASRAMGSYSLRDVQIASGEISAPRDSKGPALETALIEAALREVDLDELQATADATTQTIEIVAGIESMLMERVGSSAAPDLGALTDLAKAAHKVLATPLSERAPTAQAVGDATSGAAKMISPDQPAPGEPAHQVSRGAVNSRDDVIRALDQVCRYYEREEPSSPIPILIRRAKRLVSKDFMEILRDLAPDGVSQAELIRGPDAGD